MKSVFAVLALFIFFRLEAEARRVIHLPPIDTSSGFGQGSGACWGGMSRSISFVNLSSLPQSVTVRVSGVKIKLGTCGTGNFGGNWIRFPGIDCYSTPEISVPGFETQFVIPADGSSSLGYVAACRMLRSGVTNCQMNPNPPFAEQTTDLPPTMLHSAVDQVVIEVAEARGALIANVQGSAMALCIEFGNAPKFNMPANGGRAF